MPDYTPYPVQVLTPEKPVFDGEAQILVVPGVEGELGVLANHAPLVAMVRAGEAHVTDEGGETQRFVVDHGYLHVSGNRALLLVGEARPPDEVDAGEARERAERAREELERARGEDGGDVRGAERRLRFAEQLERVAR